MIEDRMKKYYDDDYKYTFWAGVITGVAGIYFDSTPTSLFGVGIFGITIGGQGIDYMKGYFNERLELLHQQNKLKREGPSNKVEGK